MFCAQLIYVPSWWYLLIGLFPTRSSSLSCPIIQAKTNGARRSVCIAAPSFQICFPDFIFDRSPRWRTHSGFHLIRQGEGWQRSHCRWAAHTIGGRIWAADWVCIKDDCEYLVSSHLLSGNRHSPHGKSASIFLVCATIRLQHKIRCRLLWMPNSTTLPGDGVLPKCNSTLLIRGWCYWGVSWALHYQHNHILNRMARDQARDILHDQFNEEFEKRFVGNKDAPMQMADDLCRRVPWCQVARCLLGDYYLWVT